MRYVAVVLVTITLTVLTMSIMIERHIRTTIEPAVLRWSEWIFESGQACKDLSAEECEDKRLHSIGLPCNLVDTDTRKFFFFPWERSPWRYNCELEKIRIRQTSIEGDTLMCGEIVPGSAYGKDKIEVTRLHPCITITDTKASFISSAGGSSQKVCGNKFYTANGQLEWEQPPCDDGAQNINKDDK